MGQVDHLWVSTFAYLAEDIFFANCDLLGQVTELLDQVSRGALLPSAVEARSSLLAG